MDGIQTANPLGLFAESGNLIEHSLRVGTDAAANVGFRHESKQVALGCLTYFDDQSPGIRTIDEEKRHEMMADDRADLLAFGEREAESPEYPSCPDGPSPGMPASGNPAIRFDPRAGWLGDIVQQRGEKQDSPLGLRKLPPGGKSNHCLRYQMHVTPDVPFRVAIRVLRTALHVLQPR